MKLKSFLPLALLSFSFSCCGFPSNEYMVKLILVPQNINLNQRAFSIKDTSLMSRELNNVLRSNVNYLMGSSVISRSTTGSYHRVFNQENFGYNEVGIKKGSSLAENHLAFGIQFSSKKELSYASCPEWKFICSLDSAYIFKVPGSSTHQLLLVLTPAPSYNKSNRAGNANPALQPWIKKIAIARNLDTLRTTHIPADPALVAFCNTSHIKNKSAVITQPTLLINEGSTYIVIKATQIIEKVDQRLNLVRAWGNCELIIKNGKVERYLFSDPDKLVETISLETEVTIKDKLGCLIKLQREINQ